MKSSSDTIKISRKLEKPQFIDLSGYRIDNEIKPLDYFAATLLSEKNPIVLKLNEEIIPLLEPELEMEANLKSSFDIFGQDLNDTLPKNPFSINYEEPTIPSYHFEKIEVPSPRNQKNEAFGEGSFFYRQDSPIAPKFTLNYIPQRRYQLEDRLHHPNYQSRQNSPTLESVYYRRRF